MREGPPDYALARWMAANGYGREDIREKAGLTNGAAWHLVEQAEKLRLEQKRNAANG